VAPRAPASATYRFEVSRVEAGDVYFCVSFGVCDRPTVSALQGQQRLSPVALTLSASTADDPLGPTSGFILRGETEHASAYTVSDFRYNRAVAEASTYRRLGFGPGARSGRRGRPPVLAFRLRAGAVRALGSTNEAVIRGGPAEELLGNILHPRKRFYAGGSQSVRGFGENQLGPRVLTIAPNLLRGRQIRDGDTTYTRCQPTEPIAACGARVLNDTTLPDRDFVPRPLGGTSLIEGNVELRMPVWGPVVVAAFVDGAVVGEGSLGDLGSATSAVTPGVGVRDLSPVGPVRVDVGFRPRLPEDLAVVTEEEMANGTRRLVNLTPRQGCSARPNACRRYGETSNGGFRSFLDRLTLHLSIGEAF
jgi:outer membrane protein insertion porin family/translocation and assembly module TamA